MREEQKKVIQKEMDRLEHLGIIRKGLTGYSSPVVLVKWKNQNLYQVWSDFHILNETATWPHVYQMGPHHGGHHRGCPHYLICIIYNR